MTTFYFIVSVVLFIVLAYVIYDLKRKLDRSQQDGMSLLGQIDNLDRKMSENIMHISSNIAQHIGNLQSTFDRRLHDNTNKLDTRLDNAARSFAEVKGLMSQVLEANNRIFEVGKDISSLQNILKAPKMRGGLGELFLGDLLGQIFPADNYGLQHEFKSGETVDAIIRLKGGIIPIDSKFPLENFKRMIESSDENERRQHRKTFISDVKKHIDAIAKKYILPNEGTLDFALMYVPAENVYYETIIKEGEEGLLQYSFEKKVIPVSPNTLYVYVNTILLGLKGMQVEKHALAIMNNLKRLTTEYKRFRDDFEVLGKHINDSKNKYDLADKRLEKFQNQLEKSMESELELGGQPVQIE